MPIRLLGKIRIFRSIEERVREMSELEKGKFFEKKNNHEIAAIVSRLKSDDAADTLRIFDIRKTRRIIKLLEPKKAREITELLKFPEDVAGSLMQKEFVKTEEHRTVAHAIKKIRAHKDESLHDIYVTGLTDRLIGVVSIRKLAVSGGAAKIREIMKKDVVYAFQNEPLEEVLKKMKEFDLVSLPVVSAENEIRGIITIDDVLDALQEEDTEDIYKLAGISGEPEEYFALNLKSKISKRMPWIIVFMIVETVTAMLLAFYQSTLLEVIALAFFIPLLMATGGNVGSQAATLSVRGMATGEIEKNKVMRTILSEMGTTAALAAIIASIAFFVGMFRAHTFSIALAVGVAMLGIVMVANLAGLLLPFIFKKFKIDPAVASAPLITTIADTIGVVIYFEAARIILAV
jgi:magnesium transporter